MGKGKKSGKKQKTKQEIMLENRWAGVSMANSSPLFGKMGGDCREARLSMDAGMLAKNDAAVVTKGGLILLNPGYLLTPGQWAYVVAHCKLHLAFGHFDKEKMPVSRLGENGMHMAGNDYGQKRSEGSEDVLRMDYEKYLWNMACDIYVAKFLADIKFGQPICQNPANVFGENLTDERKIYERLLEGRGASNASGTRWTNVYGTAYGMDMKGLEHPMVYDKEKKEYNRYAAQFAYALSSAATATVGKAGGMRGDEWMTKSKRAAQWFVGHYPLLGGLASAFRIIEDYAYCAKEDIQIAAAGLREEELRFVLAHEFLHAGLEHQKRQEGRDAYLWNVACDYVINGWLLEMGIGQMPETGLLYDEGLKNKSAEEIYDLMLENIRKYQKLDTFRGYGKGDMMPGGRRSYDDSSLGDASYGDTSFWRKGAAVSMDEFCRNALRQGLEYHQSTGRGYIPAGLIQEIRALCMPPVLWDVELARWFDEIFPYVEKKRTYARPSRRQGATPDIPRPRYVRDEVFSDARTFGVVIDTSGSMSAKMIGMALGSVASYAAAREVPLARVVFCDAAAYDAGYLSPEEIAGRVEVKGRGGTRLQPGVDALEQAKDFPKDGPILLITDGEIEDKMTIHREHAFLVPKGKRLPFRTRGKVFYFE